jgi:hypothetical protein
VGHPGRRGSPFLAVEVDPERGEEVRGGPLRGVQVDDALPAIVVYGLTYGWVQGRVLVSYQQRRTRPGAVG